MTRTFLCAVLAGACLLLGLATALIQAGNRERGTVLNEQLETCRMLEGVTRDRATDILGGDWGALPADPTILQRALQPRPPLSPSKPKGAQP